MIRQIIQYPTPTGFDFGGTVRHFDETLHTLLEDMKDTIEANSLEGLAAFQIASPLSVIVIKKEGQYIEMINPVIFTKEGELTPTESTAYYPHLTATTKRAQSIKVMYEDRAGKQQFLTAVDDLAVLIQRKTDYLLGSTFIARLSPEEKKTFEAKLKNISTSDTCNTAPFSDKVLTVIKYALILGLVALLGLLIPSFIPHLQTFEVALMSAIAVLIGVYFVLALYEGKRCGVCQLGNTVAVALIKSLSFRCFILSDFLVTFLRR